MNLRKDHYRFARPVAGARATRRLRTAEGRRAGLFPRRVPSRSSSRGLPRRGAAAVVSLPTARGARVCVGASLPETLPPPRETPLLVRTSSRPGGPSPFLPPWATRLDTPARLSSAGLTERAGRTSGRPRGGRGPVRCTGPGPTLGTLTPKRGSGGLRPPPHAARPRVPNSPPSFGGRRGVQCLPAPPRRGSERPGVLSSSPFQTRLVSERWQPLCGVKTHKKSCDNS